MAGALHVHDLILLRTEPAVTFPEGEPACAYLNPNQRPWVVVRRERISDGLLPVGMRGSERNERCAGFTRWSEVLETRRPDELRLLLAADSRRTLLAFQTLAYLECRLAGLDENWGPGGSVGFELASGIPAVREGSDLDLILFAPKKLEITEAQNLWRIISSAPGKVDALIETPFCGFSLQEFVTASPRKMLLRTSDGRVLGSDPWDLSNGESC
ncbi:phosphoribosyl-dephospho-CoA transferase [Silvibacterium bohemicum]|uniref:Phosphoribosyl-dephospho-CoA transferase n=1 Tax=Silvibacterium bohemicum TaxID=1577686 RepID=A0A841JP44_9BACT|nr:malonate decarboxylase holo-ACP synthase [Silvibacterium bohemicum]MBB6143116.1 phosphoribosyl-dephospho-CoA transferase [Silvibacterium bohemicum]